MAQKINYNDYAISSIDGQITFGEVFPDNVKASMVLRAGTPAPDGVPHYIRMDSDGDATQKGRRGTIVRCPGTFNVVAGDAVRENIPGIFMDSGNGDIIIKSKGRIRIEAENIDLITKGGDGENGNILLDANQNVYIKAKQSIDVNATANLQLKSEGTTELIGSAILNIYGGLVEGITGATKLKGSQAICGVNPLGTPNEILKAIKLLALGK